MWDLVKSAAVADELLDERKRQVEQEGWTAEHDDAHELGDLGDAAACYAMSPGGTIASGAQSRLWPWDRKWLKQRGDRRRDLVKAGGLIIAEIERLDRR